MSLERIREFIGNHSVSAMGLVALGAALDARATGVALDPRLAPRVDELLEAMGAGDLLDGVGAAEAAPLLAMLRITLRVDAKLLCAQTRTLTWDHPEPEILEAGGDVASAHARMFSSLVIPALSGLEPRLKSPGGAFLDIGTGVGKLAIAMARMWPELRVVGIDPWQPALSRAREHVHAADLASRIELRDQAAEQLDDESAFDLAWVPIVFMQRQAIPPAIERTARALRRGGWLVMSAAQLPADPTSAAAWRMRTTAWAGHTLGGSEAEALLRDAGLGDVHTVPMPPGSPMSHIAARRPE